MKSLWPRVLVALLTLAVLVLPLSAFVVQNLRRTADLSLNLGFVQLELARPLPVPALMLVSLLVGVLLGLGLGGMRELRVRRRLRDAHREAAFSGGEVGSGW